MHSHKLFVDNEHIQHVLGIYNEVAYLQTIDGYTVKVSAKEYIDAISTYTKRSSYPNSSYSVHYLKSIK